MTRFPVDETHDPTLVSWVLSANGHPDFPVQNLPFGIFSRAGEAPRAGVAIGDMVLDLNAASGMLPASITSAFAQARLNSLMALPAADRSALRQTLSRLLTDDIYKSVLGPALHRASDCRLHIPAAIGDYTDFYVGVHHATNVGRIFRPDNPLLPNYKYVPIGYHGRTSSIRASGEAVRRPCGQRIPPNSATPLFGPTGRLDFELELGVWVGGGTELGHSIAIADASNHIAGLCLLNDWSARDVQAWEYQPLGPFLSKNFHTTISPWVVTCEALAPFRLPQPARDVADPRPLPYLWDEIDQASGAFAIELEVWFASERMRDLGLAPVLLCKGPASNMYWTVAQLVTHHTSNGCSLRPGDLMGTGTISGPDRESLGSLLEITEGGKRPIELPTVETRTFLEDGDEIWMRARARAEGYVPIGFGECRGVIMPARC